MTNPYLNEGPFECSYQKSFLMSNKLARDLTNLLGAIVVPDTSEYNKGDDSEYNNSSLEIVETGLEIHIQPYWRERETKWSITCGLPSNVRQQVNDYTLTPFPSIFLSGAKPLEQIAKDIQRRIIKPSEAIQAEWMAKLAEVQNANTAIHLVVAEFTKRFPWVDCRIKDDKASSAEFFNKNGYPSMRGTLYADGTTSFQYFGSLSAKQTKLIFEAIAKAKES